jgi:hypothetical protein
MKATKERPSCNVCLTVDERDTIDRAKGRIRRLAPLITHLIEEPPEYIEDASGNGVLDLLDLITADVQTLDATLRQQTSERKHPRKAVRDDRRAHSHRPDAR